MSASSCERFAEIALAEAEGKKLTASELAFRREHAESCPACRREARALSLLGMPEGSAAHFRASPAERARMIDAVLGAVDAAAPAPEAENVVPFARRVRRPALWIAGLAAAAAALLLVVRHGPPAPRGPAPAARVLLASGQGLSAGVAVAEGQELAASGGETSLALGSDIVVLLDPGSRARLARLQPSGVEIALETGRVHASVKPNTPGPRLAVTTRDGRVEVTGTLFSVEARDGASELRVLRGSVKVSAGRKVSHVLAQQAQRLGADEIRAMSGPEQETELAAMRRIGLLEVSEASVLQVRSRPEGARVLLDGEAIGTTPLSAELKTGHRHLLVASAARSAEEWIDLHAGNVSIRDFDLAPPPAEEPEPEVLRPGARHPAAPRLPAEELLRRAQALRTQRDWAGSAAAYRELLAAYPASPISEPAWVSYGEILADHLGDSRGGLKACERYLRRSPGGTVAAEASACRIHALRGLGRPSDERAAIQEFLERFPSAVQAPQLRQRLGELP